MGISESAGREERPRTPFLVGDWEVRPFLNRICRDGSELALADKYMAVLYVLAAQPGEVLTRAELLETVWPDTAVVDSVLSRAIFELRQAFGDDASAPRYIETIPKVGYRLVAPVRPLDESPATAPGALPAQANVPSDSPTAARLAAATPPRAFPRRLQGWPAIAAATSVAALAWLGASVWRGDAEVAVLADVEGQAIPTVRPITTLEGREMHPALSPDGERVVFVWHADRQDWDLYVKQLRDETLLHLTEGDGHDLRPAWSPDGTRIAFVRHDASGCTLMTVPSLGGPVRELGACGGRLYSLDWSPDGRQLAFSSAADDGVPFAIFLLDLVTLERRQITAPGPETRGDVDVAFSPDGRRIAFGRSQGLGNDLHVVDIASGEIRRLTFDQKMIFGIEWLPNPERILYGSDRKGRWTLWEVDPDGAAPVWAGVVAEGAGFYDFSATPEADRIAYATISGDRDIWKMRLGRELADPVEPMIASTRWDAQPSLSPDGRRVAFYSWRSGEPAVWMAGSDGSEPYLVAAVDAPLVGAPRWSPDGTRLAYSDVARTYVVDTASLLVSTPVVEPPRATSSGVDVRTVSIAAGSTARGSGADLAPQWGPGEWLYTTSDRGDSWQVWRIPASGGVAEQVTRCEESCVLIDVDARRVLYARADGRTLMSQPIDGKPAVRVTVLPEDKSLESWAFTKAFAFRYPLVSWSVAGDGLYFARHVEERSTILRLDLVSAELTEVATFEALVSGLDVSDDEEWLLVGRGGPDQGDLHLIESYSAR